jgi:hypothetical protein
MPCLYIAQDIRQEIAHAGRIRKQKKNGRENELFLKKRVVDVLKVGTRHHIVETR